MSLTLAAVSVPMPMGLGSLLAQKQLLLPRSLHSPRPCRAHLPWSISPGPTQPPGQGQAAPPGGHGHSRGGTRPPQPRQGSLKGSPVPRLGGHSSGG